jgi:monoamine oxidase
VLVLEARDRVGGRTFNHPLGDGQVIEAGGEFVGPTQDRLLALAKSVGVGTYKAYNEGQDVLLARGLRSLYPAIPGIVKDSQDPEVYNDVFRGLNSADALGAQVGVRAPWQARGAAKLDRETLAQWAKRTFKSPITGPLLDSASEAIWGKDTSQLSLLYSAFYVAAAGDPKNKGSFGRLIQVVGGAQESRFTGGSQEIAIRVAAALGTRVLLNAPVRQIKQGRKGVTVVADGVTVDAKQVIVALPPVLARQIKFEPALPAAHQRLLVRYTPGDMIKAQLIYDRPWWRDKGLSGQIVVDSGPIGASYDNTPPSGAPGVILGFIGGRQAVRYRALSEADRRRALIDELAATLGDEARSPTDFFEMDWTAEAWTRGCPTGSMAPGVLSRFGAALRAPSGRIHWAGTETSDYWAGYMDGAIRSGERAAKEVLRALG